MQLTPMNENCTGDPMRSPARIGYIRPGGGSHAGIMPPGRPRGAAPTAMTHFSSVAPSSRRPHAGRRPAPGVWTFQGVVETRHAASESGRDMSRPPAPAGRSQEAAEAGCAATGVE